MRNKMSGLRQNELPTTKLLPNCFNNIYTIKPTIFKKQSNFLNENTMQVYYLLTY